MVRAGHWTLVAAFFTAYAAGDRFGRLHEWAGYLIGVVVGVRLIWGLVGPEHARFRSFVRGPAATIRYLSAMVHRREPRYLGHNPAGAVMICVLLLALAGVVASGLVLEAGDEGPETAAGIREAGEASATPYGGAVADGVGSADRGEVRHNAPHIDAEEADASRHERLEAIHVFFVDATLLLVGLHIAGVLYAGHVHGEDLIGAMISGRKPARPEGGQDA